MKIFVMDDSKPQYGGGWSWKKGFCKAMGSYIVDNYYDATHIIVPGASMVKPEKFEQAKLDGKRIILRCDNFLRHSRNQGKGMARMQRMAAVADLVVYQCQWAKDILDDFLGHPNSRIIYNGVDLDIFKPEGDKIKFDSNDVYIYASASKGDNKGWDTCWYEYQKIQKSNTNAMLLIAGKVSTEVMRNNFDFFQGERYQYLGMVDTPEKMSTVFRSGNHFMGVAQYDCYSNAALEAAMCGLDFVHASHTGGMPELIENIKKGREFNGLPRMIEDYKLSIQGLS